MFSNLWFHQFDYDVPQCGVVCIYPTWSIYPAKLIGLKVKVFVTLGKVLVIISSNRLFLPQYEPLLSPRLQHEWWTVSCCPTGHEELHFSSVLFFSVLWCLCLQSAQKCWGVGGGAPRDPHSCCKSVTFDNCVCSGVMAGACTDGVDGQTGLAMCLRSQV